MDKHLEGKDHLVGDRCMIADPYTFAMTRWGNKLSKSLSDYPNLFRFYQHLREDAGVQQAMAQQDIH